MLCSVRSVTAAGSCTPTFSRRLLCSAPGPDGLTDDRPTATVVGSGVFGVSAAYFLGRQGYRVTVLDNRPTPGEGTSKGNACSLRTSTFGPMASPQMPRKMLSAITQGDPLYRFDWKKLLTDVQFLRWGFEFLYNCYSPAVQQRTRQFLEQHSPYFCKLTYDIAEQEGLQLDGSPLNPDTTGAMTLFLDTGIPGDPEAMLKAAAEGSKELIAQGHKIEVLDREAVLAREPALTATADRVAGAILAHDDSLLDSSQFAKTLAKAASTRFGAEFKNGPEHAASQLQRVWCEQSAQYRIDGVVTAGGEQFRSDVVVLAAGSHTAVLGQSVGLRIPIYPVKGYSLTMDVPEGRQAPDGLTILEPAQMYVSRLGKRVRFTSIAEFSGWDEDHITDSCIETVRKRAAAAFPELQDQLKTATPWAGGRPQTPDDLPIVSKTRVSNLFVASGGGSYGWRTAAGMGELLAQLVRGDEPKVDASIVSLDRFRFHGYTRVLNSRN